MVKYGYAELLERFTYLREEDFAELGVYQQRGRFLIKDEDALIVRNAANILRGYTERRSVAAVIQLASSMALQKFINQSWNEGTSNVVRAALIESIKQNLNGDPRVLRLMNVSFPDGLYKLSEFKVSWRHWNTEIREVTIAL